VDDYGGVFPSTPDALRKLPGVGHYTAGAIAAFAFEQDVAFLDTNMRRVVHRLLFGSDVPERQATERELLAAADRLLGEGSGWLWNQALIEFGALQCTQRRPACVVCPLSRDCAAYPVIQSELAAVPVGTRLKSESEFQGSNRQYRGRVVEELRRSQRVTLTELGPRVKPDFGEADREWLLGLVNRLAGDGLLAIREPEPPYRTDDQAADLVVSLPD
jgi:A/G-specific adenine glycosylase